MGQLEKACRVKGRLKAGSEMNLLAIGKSLKGHIAATASSAASEVGGTGNGHRGCRKREGLGRASIAPLPAPFFRQGSFLTPLLKRTASAKSALKPSPSPVIVEKGNVLQKRKVPAGSAWGGQGGGHRDPGGG